MKTRIFPVLATLLVLASIGLLLACSGGNSSQTSTMGTVSTTVSDPPTCAAPSGSYQHVWLTIKDVKIHQSANAGPNDSGWVDLTPNLSAAPQQVDMLAIANNNCFLATLGSQVALEAGSYQQIRVFLGDNSDANNLASANQCAKGTGVNCVQLTNNSWDALNLSSEATTGIKIPSGQLAGGAFTIAPGEVKDLNIDFDACASIIAQGSGFRLKPVLHAGEVHLTASSVSGQLVDSFTKQPITGGKAIVALEQNQGGTETVVMEVTPDSTGHWVLCPVPAGTFDIVAVAVDGSNVAYAATVTTGVQAGIALGPVPMVAQPGGLPDASITGNITTTTGSAATSADVTLAAVQTVNLGSGNVNVIIPLAQQSSATALVSTANNVACTAPNTDCAAYTLAVPAMWPSIGAYNSGGTTYNQDTTTNPVAYSVYAWAFYQGTPDCSTNPTIVNTLLGGGAIAVSPGVSVSAATAAFTGCQ